MGDEPKPKEVLQCDTNMNPAISIDIFHSTLLRNFWVQKSLHTLPDRWEPKDANVCWVLRVFSGSGCLSQLMHPFQISSKFFIRRQHWTPSSLQPPLFQSLDSASTALFFPLKPLMLLWDYLVTQINQTLPASQRLWRGLRVLALDTTILWLPETLWPYFGALKSRNADGHAECRTAVLYDIFARIPLRCKPGNVKFQDKHLVRRFFHYLKPGILLLLDAGFYSLPVFLNILDRGAHFLIPMMHHARPKLLKAFSAEDGLYEIRSAKRLWPILKNRKTLIVRIVTAHLSGFRPRRLVSSLLDPEAFPAQEVANLYHQRWHIETFFREFKHILCAQTWHAKTHHAFYVELIFLMLLSCLTRLAITQSGLAPHEASFGKSLSLLKRILQLAAFIPSQDWEQLYKDFLTQLSDCKIDIRPGRSYERNATTRRLNTRIPITTFMQNSPHVA